jgi:hypothetical protein
LTGAGELRPSVELSLITVLAHQQHASRSKKNA